MRQSAEYDETVKVCEGVEYDRECHREVRMSELGSYTKIHSYALYRVRIPPTFSPYAAVTPPAYSSDNIIFISRNFHTGYPGFSF